MRTKKSKEWRVYKPKKTNDGAASKLELSVETTEKEKDGKKFTVREALVFWVSSKQTGTDNNGNASFGWSDEEKQVTLKLGEVDIGEMLTVLNGKKEATGGTTGTYAGKLFHKNSRGSTSFSLKKGTNGGYFLAVTKKLDNNPAIQVSHTLTYGEAEVLRVLLESAIRQMYEW